MICWTCGGAGKTRSVGRMLIPCRDCRGSGRVEEPVGAAPDIPLDSDRTLGAAIPNPFEGFFTEPEDEEDAE